MQTRGPKGRANYEPNSWAEGGPRADPVRGFRSFPEPMGGEKRKLRAESFADHYSQARLFYRSQTPVEQRHIADAIVFELSKVETPAIRERVVGHLPNIDAALAAAVVAGLGLSKPPTPAVPAVPPIDLPPSDKLSILKNAAGTFEGRKLGVLLTDGIDAQMLDDLTAAFEAEGAVVETIAAKVYGVTAAGGKRIEVRHKIDGAPSVVFDAVAVMASEDGIAALVGSHPAKSFAADAFAHAKFIGLGGAARKLLEAAGVNERDGGVIDLANGAKPFAEACRALRFWDRVA